MNPHQPRHLRPALLLGALLLSLTACCAAPSDTPDANLRTGAQRVEVWEPMLRGSRVGLLSNATGVINDTLHVADLMLAQGIQLTTLFSPEHGFRGTADAGEKVGDSVDPVTGLPVVSLYNGSRQKLNPEALAGIDKLVVDLQDVGVRFYTYYISMMEMMDLAARAGKPVVVFDRPNPLGMVVDGPLLQQKHFSGVGRIPVPAIHGMTMGELALMIAGEGWIDHVPQLEVVTVEGYTHSTRYHLPVAPSPNLRSMQAIYLYPSICLFEGTPVSVGRGTSNPFTLYGHPSMRNRSFTFTPQPNAGAKNPLLKGQLCQGVDLSHMPVDSIIARGFDLSYVIDAYADLKANPKFFTSMFNLLAGTDLIRQRIVAGDNAEAIRSLWADDVASFRRRRQPYLLYPE